MKKLTVKVLNSISEIGENEWNSIVGKDEMICTYRYLRAIEESGINVDFYRYPVFYEDGVVVAHTCICGMTFDLDIFARGVAKKFIGLVRKGFPNFLKLKLFECGTPVALGSTISFKEGVDKQEILKLLAKTMEDVARQEKIGVLILRDFVEGDLPVYKSFEKMGFTRISNLPNTELEGEWNTFEEYLGSMRCKYRKKVRERIKKAQDGGIKIEVLDSFSQYAPDFLKLWTNTYNKAKEYKREILAEDFFRKVDVYFGKDSKAILFKKDEKILGFMLTVKDDVTMRALFIGIDYEFNNQYFTYFNLLYNLVDQAIKDKKRKVELGITTVVPKMDLGARLIPLYAYMKHINPLLNKIIPKAFKIMFPEEHVEPRKVFRD